MNRYLGGNRIQLLRNGGEYFPALLSEIAAAMHTVHLETYIFEPDRTGLEVADALLHLTAMSHRQWNGATRTSSP